jgi:O-6-methylguanine DNA methyltransferase
MRQTGRMTFDVATITLAGPFGPYRVAATDRGVAAAGWDVDARSLAETLARRGSVRELPTGSGVALLQAVRPLIEQMLGGGHVDTRSIPLDLRGLSPFDQRVLLAVREIQWGETASYGEVARRAGAPRAARAAGGSIRRNPISLLIPCHRVIASDGTLGGYGGDGPHERAEALERKRLLLLREGVNVPGWRR